MDLVNSLGNTINRTVGQANDFASSSSEASRGAIKTATDVSGAILDIYKCNLLEVESYLATYEAKLKLEEEYVKGLRAMNDKSKESLVKLDARIASSLYIEPGGAHLPKARQAWKSMRDDHLKELDARLRHIDALRLGVIAPLIAYRDAQERIRKRVKEDMKICIGRYDEMRNVTVPRARKHYEKKCEEVEQVRLQQQAIEDQRTLLTTMSREPSSQGGAPSPIYSGDDEEERAANGPPLARRSISFRQNRKSDNGSSATRPASAGISPKMAAEAHLSQSPNPNDKKGGHFLDALRNKENWDAARKEAPKKFNALFNKMREGGSGGSNEKGGDPAMLLASPNGEAGVEGRGAGLGLALGGGPGSIKSSHNIALKNVKTKREAEEADQAYRRAVFDLETLRLQRKKTVSAAITSVVEGRRELYLLCQAVWLQAEVSTQSFASSLLETSGQAIQTVQSSLDTLDEELKRLESRVPSLSDVDEGKIRYVNYYIGECKDLIFGVSLVDYAFNRAQRDAPWLGPSKVEAPLILRKCVAFIEERITTQGIYRISAKHTAIQNLAHAVERDEEQFEFDPSQDEPAAVAGVLKLYLRQLPEPVMPIPWEERIRYTHERKEQIQSGFAALKSRIRRLPAINQATLKLIVEHLAKVASYSEQNKMTIANLSIVFGPLLLSQADHETTSIAAAMEEDRVTEDLILYCHDIFGDLNKAGAPLLPPLNTTASRADDNGLELPAMSSLADHTPIALTRTDSNTPIAPVLRAGSLRRSNAITKGNLADVEEAKPRAVSDPIQVISAEPTASLRLPGEWDHEASEEDHMFAVENVARSPPPEVPMFGDSSADEPNRHM